MNTQSEKTSVVTAGRSDIDDYFRLHVGRQGKLAHSPLLAFRQSEAGIAVDIVIKPEDLLGYGDDTPVMGIWPGQYRSDYFHFTVGQYRVFYEAR